MSFHIPETGRDRRRRAAPGGDHHLQRREGAARRVPAPLRLPLHRLPRPRADGARSCGCTTRASTTRCSAPRSEAFYVLRSFDGLHKRPTTSELIDWVQALVIAGHPGRAGAGRAAVPRRRAEDAPGPGDRPPPPGGARPQRRPGLAGAPWPSRASSTGCGPGACRSRWTSGSALQEALARGLADSSLSRFYLLARALLVKSRAPLRRLRPRLRRVPPGLEQTDDAIADRVWEWLAERPERPRDERRAARARSTRRWRASTSRPSARGWPSAWRNQTEAHHGGSRHIGTGGTSPFGHSGWHPGGIRIGGRGAQPHRRPDRRPSGASASYRADETLGVREMGVALRRLRRLTTRLDGPGRPSSTWTTTIDATADAGGGLRLVFRRPRRNAVRVLLLLDVGGSMDEHAAPGRPPLLGRPPGRAASAT